MRRLSAVGLLTLAMAVWSCGNSGGGGGAALAGPPLTVGALFDLSGATADVGTPFASGVRDYWNWKNKHGGVAGGRQVILEWHDYAYQVPQAEQFYSQFVADKAVAIQGYGTADTNALRDKIVADKVPYTSLSYDAALTDPTKFPYNFVPGTSYSDQLEIALNWIVAQSPGHNEVAFFHSNSPFGTSPIADGRKYITDKHLDIGFSTYAMASDPTALTAQVTQAKRTQNAKYVIIQNIPKGGAAVAKNVASLGGGMKLICLNWCTNEVYIKTAGEMSEGTVGIAPWLPVNVAGSDAPALKDPIASLRARGGDVTVEGGLYSQAWLQSSLVAHAIDQAASSGQPTGESIRAALEKISNFDTGGIAVGNISFSATNHQGLRGAVIGEVKDGKWIKLEGKQLP